MMRTVPKRLASALGESRDMTVFKISLVARFSIHWTLLNGSAKCQLPNDSRKKSTIASFIITCFKCDTPITETNLQFVLTFSAVVQTQRVVASLPDGGKK
jgi:hypothetical protein